MSAAPVLTWTRAETRRQLIGLATRVACGEPGAADAARSLVPLIAAECCPNAIKVFFRLATAIGDGRTGSADVALEELLGGDAA